jgi:tight adherence protein B
MTSPAAALLLLVGVLGVGIAGLRIFYVGWAQKADTMERARLDAGERASRRVRGAVEATLRRTRIGRKVQLRLAAAGVELGLIDFVGGTLLAVAVAYVLADLIVPPWLAAALALVAARLCFFWIDYKRAQRRDDFVAQLPDLARVLSNCSSAGLSLRSAIDMATSELEDPASGELATVAEELRLGQSVDLALERLQERMPSREVGVLVATLVIQQRAGGDLVRSLRDMADTLDARKDLRREVRTIMAGAVFTSYIVAALGLGTLLMLNQVSPGVIDDMVASAWGRIALTVGGSLYALGFVLIRRTTRIET